MERVAVWRGSEKGAGGAHRPRKEGAGLHFVKEGKEFTTRLELRKYKRKGRRSGRSGSGKTPTGRVRPAVVGCGRSSGGNIEIYHSEKKKGMKCPDGEKRTKEKKKNFDAGRPSSKLG